VDHEAFERARATLVELEPARDRLDPELDILRFYSEPRQLEHQVMNQLVVQGLHLDPTFFLSFLSLQIQPVDLDLRVEGMNDRIRVEEQFQDRTQHLADPPQDAAMRVIDSTCF